MQETPLRDAAARVALTLQQHGYNAFFAGGCVRDLLIGREPKDFDIATDANPGDIQTLFPNTEAVGRAFGVILVKEDSFCFEVATFRRDLSYSDGRRPDAVTFCGPEEDARRRDFGINALFYDPVAEQVLDYVNGREDLDRKIVRAVGDPAERFREDHLRMLRAVRFASVLEFAIENRTAEAIRENAPLIERISVERIRTELERIFAEAPRPGTALVMLRDLKLLVHILPELHALLENETMDRTASMLNQMRIRSSAMGYAVLFHATADADTAGRVMKRLRCSTDEMDAVSACIRHLSKLNNFAAKPESEKRMIVAGRAFPLQMELFRISTLNDPANFQSLEQYAAAHAGQPLPAPWVRGGDLMDQGVPQGPDMKVLLDKAFRAQLDGRFKDKAALLNWLLNSNR